MELGSIFHISGSIKLMRMKVTLIQRGLSFLPNFNEFTTDGPSPRTISNIIVDELNLQWQQKISSPFELDSTQEDSSRKEARLFTLIHGDKLPEGLNTLIQTNKNDENDQDQDISKFLSRVSINHPIIDRPEKRNFRAIKHSIKVMYIMTYLGNLMGDRSDRDNYFVCRISLLNERIVKFEPPLKQEGYRIQSKIGEYTVRVIVWDDFFDSLTEKNPAMDFVPSIPETHTFEHPEENLTRVSCLVNIESASDFIYDNIWIEYKIKLPENIKCTSYNTEGHTSCCMRHKANKKFYFSHIFEIDFSVKMFDRHLYPRVAFRICSENYWGRQYVAGFGSLTLHLKPGRKISTVNCWMPVDQHNPTIKMQEFFMGRTMYCQDLKEDGEISQKHLHAEFSGTLRIVVANIVQNRQFMSRETLNHLKYGAVFRKICLKPDLYWRIMKVLLEFDEARRELLRISAA